MVFVESFAAKCQLLSSLQDHDDGRDSKSPNLRMPMRQVRQLKEKSTLHTSSREGEPDAISYTNQMTNQAQDRDVRELREARVNFFCAFICVLSKRSRDE